MARGSKKKYTTKQKRKAEHIEQSYMEKGLPSDVAEARAWATVNKQSGGGERSGGSGREKSEPRKRASRKDSAERAAATRKGVSRQGRLESMTKDALMEEARRRNLKGRSSMRKQELVAALKDRE